MTAGERDRLSELLKNMLTRYDNLLRPSFHIQWDGTAVR